MVSVILVLNASLLERERPKGYRALAFVETEMYEKFVLVVESLKFSMWMDCKSSHHVTIGTVSM